MATVRFSTTPGETPYQITQATGAATVSEPVELTIDLANVMQGNTVAIKKQEAIDAVQRILDYLKTSNWPPA